MCVYRFGPFVLDTGLRELRSDGKTCHLEPQVFDLIVYLIENRGRVVGRDELVEAIWRGRIVSDSTLSSRVWAARRALRDDGGKQAAIKTLPRRGFRFIANVEVEPKRGSVCATSTAPDGVPASAPSDVDLPEGHQGTTSARRPSVLVAHFEAKSRDRSIAKGLTRDITIGLARLRSVFVIAQATAFELREKGLSPLEAGQLLDVDFCVFGDLAREGPDFRITLELVAPRQNRLLWADELRFPAKEAHEAPQPIAARIVASLSAEIELFESHRAILRSSASLDAWGAYHLGLWHLYRFTDADNDSAQGLFERAVALDPTFSRAYAALSYAHWMNAFAFRPGDKGAERDRAFDAAGRGLQADPKDPAALWSMSRALWMRNDEVAALRTIDRAIALSPSFALAHHTRSFVQCQTGDAAEALSDCRLAQRLSPFDPWKYAMLGVEAFSFARLRRYEEAAEAARRLTRKPNAHAQARGLAALVLAVSGALDEARREIAVVQQLSPQYGFEEFLSAYHVGPDMMRDFERAAAEIGIT